MKAYHHLLTSIVVGLIPPLLIPGLKIHLSVLAAVAAGVLIDIDHVPLSRFYHGDWRNFKLILENPVKVYTGRIEAEWFPVWMRNITHFVFTLCLLTAYILTGSVYILIGAVSAGFHLATEPVYDHFVRGEKK